MNNRIVDMIKKYGEENDFYEYLIDTFQEAIDNWD